METRTFTWITTADIRLAGISFTLSTRPIACTRCGGLGGSKAWPGFTCYRCGGSKLDPKHAEDVYAFATDADAGAACALDVAAYTANVAACDRAEAARVAALASFRESLNAHPVVVGLRALISDGVRVADDIVERLACVTSGDGVGSGEVLAGLGAVLATIQAKRKEDADRLAAGVSLPTGRVDVVGVVASTKEQCSQFGSVMKCLIVSDAGWRVWGTLPRGAAKGDRVKFKATVEVQAGDPLFGFYSRPSAAEIVS